MNIIRVIRQYNFLEKFIIIYSIWSIFTGFRRGFGGIFASAFYGSVHIVIQFALVLTFYRYMKLRPDMFARSHKTAAVIYSLGYLFCILFSFNGAFESFNRYILPILYGSGFILLTDKVKIKVSDAIVRILAFIFSLSIIEYIIYVLVGFKLDLFVTVEDSMEYYQSLFNVFPQFYAIIPRFMSLCEEPGVVGF